MNEITLSQDYLMMMRQALLLQLDAIEKALGLFPRTSELRKEAKDKAKMEEKKEIVVK